MIDNINVTVEKLKSKCIIKLFDVNPLCSFTPLRWLILCLSVPCNSYLCIAVHLCWVVLGWPFRMNTTACNVHCRDVTAAQ